MRLLRHKFHEFSRMGGAIQGIVQHTLATPNSEKTGDRAAAGNIRARWADTCAAAEDSRGPTAWLRLMVIGTLSVRRPSLIGEALGIDPDPKAGGTDGPVSYIVFTGESGRITDPRDYANHAKAREIGVRRAKQLLAESAASSTH